jgi:hypothetical protein
MLTEIAGRCMAGLLSNPSVVQANGMSGFDIANATMAQVSEMAWIAAGEIMNLRAKL